MNVEFATKAAKFVAGSVVGAGVGKIVKEIIVNNTDDPESKIAKIEMYAGAAVIGMIAKDASKTYISTKIDSTVERVQKLRSRLDEKKETTEEKQD